MKTETTQTTQTTTEPLNQGSITPETTPIAPIPPILPISPIPPIPAPSAPTPTDLAPDPDPKTEPQHPKPDARPKARRLRRSSRPTGTPRARCSRMSSASNQKPKIKNHKSESFQPLPEFASLPPDQLETIHDFIRHHTYEESIAFLREQLGVEISLNRLFRYRSRLDLATQLEIADDNAPAIENLLALLAGKPVDIDAAGLHIIKQRALALAARPDAAPSILMNLFRIFTWEHRKTVAEHRMRSLDRRDKCRERMAKVAERRQNLAEKKFKKETDDEGLTMEEQMEAARNLYGDFPPVLPLDAPPQPCDIV